jgi:hypothetical protein
VNRKRKHNPAAHLSVPGMAIAGKAGAGKTQLAFDIIERLSVRGITGCRTSFADPIRAEVAEIYGLRKGDPGWRDAMLEHGRRRREEDPLYWLKQAGLKARQLQLAGVVPIFDDLRLPSELAMVRNMGFYTIRLDADTFTRRARLRKQGLDMGVVESRDATETALDKAEFSLRFSNGADTTREELRQYADEVIQLAAGWASNQAVPAVVKHQAAAAS